MNKQLLKNLLVQTQEQLLNGLEQLFPECIATHDYILVPGDIPVLMVAHLDTVHRTQVTATTLHIEGDKWFSPSGIGGDDRCGVYALINVHGYTDKKPWLLFTTDEEVGGLGVKKFLKDYPEPPVPFNYMVEMDRKGNREAVYYRTRSQQFQDYITSYGFYTNHGTYTDIVDLTREWNIPSVNLSVGYYRQHSRDEYIMFSELETSIWFVVAMLNEYKPIEFTDFDTYDPYGWTHDDDESSNTKYTYQKFWDDKF